MGKIKALIDTNVLLDHLAKRAGFSRDKKGFLDFDIPVMTPAEFVAKAKE